MKKAPVIPKFSHADLVEVAVRYLRGRGHHAVLADLNMNMGEIPDAIGWTYDNSSTLIEVKVSRSDFHADKDKLWRKLPNKGMGRYRFYMVPKGLLSETDLQDFTVETGFLPSTWGLLEVDSAKRVRLVKAALPHKERHTNGEMMMLIGSLRRLALRLEVPLHKALSSVYNPHSTKAQPLKMIEANDAGDYDIFNEPFTLDGAEEKHHSVSPWFAGMDDSWLDT